MPIELLETDGVQAPDLWTLVGAATKPLAVRSTSGGGSYITATYPPFFPDKDQAFTIDNTALTGAASISTLKVKTTSKGIGGGPTRGEVNPSAFSIKITSLGSSSYQYGFVSLSTPTSHEAVFATKPGGGAWTVAALNDLVVTVELDDSGAEGEQTIQMTQAYVEVTYTAAIILSGTSTAASSMVGNNLAVRAFIAGTPGAGSSMTSNLLVRTTVAGTSTAGSSMAASPLSVLVPITGTPGASSSMEATNLHLRRNLSGTSDASSDYSGTLRVGRNLSGISTAGSSMVSILEVSSAGHKFLGGLPAGESSMSASPLDVTAFFSGTSGAGSAYAGTFTVTTIFTGTSTASSFYDAGPLKITIILAGVPAAGSSYSTGLAVNVELGGTIESSSRANMVLNVSPPYQPQGKLRADVYDSGRTRATVLEPPIEYL